MIRVVLHCVEVQYDIILTTGHCVNESLPEFFQVRAGSSLQGEGGVVRDVTRIRVHPQYDVPPLDNDVALVWLAQNLEYGVNIQPVDMAAGAELPVGTELLVSGWGLSEANNTDSLRKVIVPSVSQDTCQQYYPQRNITNTMLCAGPEQGGKGVCFGDSGGPLIYNRVQYGIVSWGRLPCAGPRLPGVYASVAGLRSWIDISGGI